MQLAMRGGAAEMTLEQRVGKLPGGSTHLCFYSATLQLFQKTRILWAAIELNGLGKVPR